MFKPFPESSRMVVVTAQEEARALRHAAIGGEHLVLGITKEAPVLLNVGLDVVRGRVIELFGTGQTGWARAAQVPFTAVAMKALELAVEEADDRGHDAVLPAHVLLGLLRADDRAHSLIEALGRPVDDVRKLAETAADQTASRAPTDVHQAAREGRPVLVGLPEGLPIGDLGNPRTDAGVLLAMLAAGGRAAALLRDHGVDEDAIRRLTPDF
jgi:ATP-dependent Clp protease ATP-binding subunit ClpA